MCHFYCLVSNYKRMLNVETKREMFKPGEHFILKSIGEAVHFILCLKREIR